MSSRKWTCHYCTYENWPKSTKCTLCRQPRALQVITTETPVAEQDIYKMAPQISPCSGSRSGSPSPTSSGPLRSSSMDPTNKWACQVCTYLNWPKANKCTQCLTVRPKVIIAPPTTSRDPTQPLSINVMINENTGSSSAAKRSPNSPEAAKAMNNDINRAVAAVSKSGKWTCKGCTYSNWPRTLRCILCGTIKGMTYMDTMARSSSSENMSEIEAGYSIRAAGAKRLSPPGTARCLQDNIEAQAVGGATASGGPPEGKIDQDKNEREKGSTEDRRLRQIKKRLRDSDWLWLNACQGVVDGDTHAVEAYLASGGSPARQMSMDECMILNRPSAFEMGYTLVHLAIRFQREDMLAALLTATEAVKKGKKRMPSHVSPDLSSDILREISAGMRQRKGDFPCYFLTDLATFTLPPDIADLPRPVQKRLFDEILDRDVQKELEVEEPIINWNLEITERLGSRLYALWNRTAGDCLLDSALQATWGVFDRDNMLRRSLADSLNEGASSFYPRWKETEGMQAESLHFSLDEAQWQQDWSILLSLASQPGASLEQIHVFSLAHILRRPIIVYGIKFVKSFRGENIGLARFQGVYLPLLWEQSFCWKTPIALGYTRGHFSALVPMEIDTYENIGAGANIETSDDAQISYLPLTDCEGKLLPVHFLQGSEIGKEELILRKWLDCCETDGGLLVAQQKVTKRPPLVRQMMDEWLDRYRRLTHMIQASQKPVPSKNLSSGEETDDE